MRSSRFDAVVVGAGPAGSVAALCLARGGARTALVDRARFPRDKACGDLLSPRALHVLDELAVPPRGARRIGSMRLVGPSGRSVALPWPNGPAFPNHAAAVPRLALDEQLREAALAAGAELVHADVQRVDLRDAGASLAFAGGTELRADFVVGADGSLSRVAESTGLGGATGALWGFALRYYVDAEVTEPSVVYWEPTRRRAFPGYGWVFPSTDGRANVGLGVAAGKARSGAQLVAGSMPAFVDALDASGLIDNVDLSRADRRGGWLRMGLSGTRPARRSVLLVGDAAGLVNPLAGEGISAAVSSGRAAADAILSDPARAAERYVESLRARHGAFYPTAAPLQAFMVRHPRVLSVAARLLTAPGLGTALGPGWSIYWNDLVDGASPGSPRFAAGSIGALANAVTSRSRMRRSIAATLADSGIP